MANTKQDSAINAANTVINMMASMDNLLKSAQAFVSDYNAEGYNSTWSSMATAPYSSDGSLGAADGSPNTAHAITVGPINRSANQLIQGVVALEQFINLLTNQSVTTANYQQSINDLLG